MHELGQINQNKFVKKDDFESLYILLAWFERNDIIFVW